MNIHTILKNIYTKNFILVIYMVFISCEIEDGISYIVGAGKRDCFYRDMKVGDAMDFDMQVLMGGDADISVTIKAPSGEAILDIYKQVESANEFTMKESGPYEICFDNTFSLYSDKTIYFDLGIDEHNRTFEDEAKFRQELKLPEDSYENKLEIMKTLDSIAVKFEIISHVQGVFRSRYTRHNYLIDSNLSLVTYFSMGSCFVMIVVGILQVVLIRSLFDNKSAKGMQTGL